MQKLSIRNIEVFAFHGCLEEEAKIGSRFSVDVEVEGEFGEAMQKDELSMTVDYVKVHHIVRREMSIRSKLIEHVAFRILAHMKKEFPVVQRCTVAVTKYCPPVNGQAGDAVFMVSA